MALHLYNTLSRTKEEFKPVTPGHAGIYYCGPTVYSEPHLGHARGPITFDVLKRWLLQQGYAVRLVSNITDVGHLVDDADDGEDKLLRRAALEKLEPMEIADKYFWEYEDAMSRLNVLRPDISPRASGHISEQIAMIEDLMAAGLAYVANGSVYFDVTSWADYGRLSGRTVEEQQAGARVDVRAEKHNPRDFALWKNADPEHIMRWPSPWGIGYPGWHIECSAMSTKYLGSEFDIHGGGMDLIFPHHEAEIAQAKGSGHAFARYWMHFNAITLEGEKMSKSRNHVVNLAEIFTRYDPAAVRFYILRSHYRSVVDFSDESLTAAVQGLRRLHDTATLLLPHSGAPDASHPEITEFRERFAAALNDDLNTPQAVAVLFDASRAVNRRLADGDAPEAYLAAAGNMFRDYLGDVLGLMPETSSHAGAGVSSELVTGIVELLLEQRSAARRNRDFESSDRIRDRLNELGIVVEDSTEGTRIKLP